MILLASSVLHIHSRCHTFLCDRHLSAPPYRFQRSGYFSGSPQDVLSEFSQLITSGVASADKCTRRKYFLPPGDRELAKRGLPVLSLAHIACHKKNWSGPPEAWGQPATTATYRV
ncbi:unnamed protein product [Ectocarpus sp. 12 AP-2014]